MLMGVDPLAWDCPFGSCFGVILKSPSADAGGTSRRIGDAPRKRQAGIRPGAVNLSLPMKRKQLVLRDLYWSARRRVARRASSSVG